jgi:prevent-host-death family protein
MPHIDVHEARDRLPVLIERARRGEDVVLTEDDRPLARLVAARDSKRRKPGSAEGLIQMSDDFDEPLDDFDEYT